MNEEKLRMIRENPVQWGIISADKIESGAYHLLAALILGGLTHMSGDPFVGYLASGFFALEGAIHLKASRDIQRVINELTAGQ